MNKQMNELADALRPFAQLCLWLKMETEEGPDGEIWGTQDFEFVLWSEATGDAVTAGMIRQSRRVLAGLDN